MGREELISDPRFTTPDDRVKNSAELDSIISAWAGTRTKHEAMEQVGGAGIPAGAVFDTMELMNDKNFEERGIMQVMQHPSYKPFKMPAWPVRIDGKPPQVKPSPILGQHTEDVLKSWLGLSEADVKSLHGDGIL
jgi:crotonobetainyl-CoA:carnitine CoA-transferase CaiB-like acyl-CoA transferase